MTMNTNEALKNAIETIIPKSLDDIIRINRDRANLRVSTDLEVMDLHAQLTYGIVKETLNDWNFISPTVSGMVYSFTHIYLLGNKSRNSRSALITSAVKGIDLDRGLVELIAARFTHWEHRQMVVSQI